MLLYSYKITSRLQYITDFIGKEIAGQPLHVTNDIDEYKIFGGPKINYSPERVLANEYWIKTHSLLFETDIKQQAIECFEVSNHKAFFKTEGDFPFDIFAASFYLLSRYEEYLPHQKDWYGRYAHENSVAFKENFLNKPLIDIWLDNFRKSLELKFPLFTIHYSPFTFLPTYDIDEAYSYKHKDWRRSAGATIKDLLKGKWDKLSLRRNVLNNNLQDPFDAYEWMDNLHQFYKLKPRYFFLVPEKTGKYDRNILPNELALQTLIRQHADKYNTGVHPSWQSGDDIKLIKKEINTIEQITQIKITSSRQHFIRFTLPQTFHNLIDAGIKEDFSMGYGNINGFRASVASPFYWYDLEKDETTDLLLYPFCYMEANSFYEQKISPEQAFEEMQYYYREVKAVNGTLITIWHNTFLGTEPAFKGWRDMYSRFVNEVCNQTETVRLH